MRGRGRIQAGMAHRGDDSHKTLILEVVQGLSPLHPIQDRCYHPYIQLLASWEVGLPLLLQSTTLIYHLHFFTSLWPELDPVALSTCKLIKSG